MFLSPINGIVYVLVPLAVLFGLFAGRTLLRQMTKYEVSDTGLRSSGPIKFAVRWSELANVELRYYSTRRDRGRGWMQLRIKSQKRTIRLDSTLEGFSDIVARAAREAAQRDIAMNEPTLDNLRVLGIVELSESTIVPIV